jgi:hypothetical protein
MTALLFLLLAGAAEAGFQEVTVTSNLDQNSSMMDTVELAKTSAFVTAVHREALDILPASLHSARSRALEEILKPRAEKMVFSYSELERNMDDRTLALSMSVGVNAQALKAELKSWGIYYTALQELTCSVSVRGETQEERQRLDTLMLITGIKESPRSMDLSLQVRKISQQPVQWDLRLTGPEMTLTRSGSELDSAWHDLWSEYFSLDRVRDRFGQSFTVQVAGWSTSSELQSFQTRLVEWSRELDTAELKRVAIRPEGLSGFWQVRTMDREAFEDRLRREAGQYGLDVSFASGQADGEVL